jgi:methionine-rich copper-binding protein CopC
MIGTAFRARARLAAFLALLSLLAVPGLVWAHAELDTSDPADGSTVEGTPEVIVADFTEALADGSRLVLRGPDGERAAEGRIDESNDTRMIIEPPELAAGDYEVRWTAVAEDGHVERGSYSFTVVAAATPEPTDSPSPTLAPTDAPTDSPAPTPVSSVSPEPTGGGTDTAATTTDALIPIIAALALVAILGGFLLSRRRPTARP